MTTKLTLTIEDKVIRSAKRYAERKGCSLSALVENYLRTLTSEDETVDELAPKVKRLLGSVKLPTSFDYKKELREARKKR